MIQIMNTTEPQSQVLIVYFTREFTFFDLSVSLEILTIYRKCESRIIGDIDVFMFFYSYFSICARTASLN